MFSSLTWCLGIRKDHCRTQWNLGRETAKDGGNPHGEVSIVSFRSLYVCPMCASTPSLSSAVSCQCDTTPCSFISCFSPHCAVCLNFFTYLSYFNCTHSVFFTFPYLSSHSAAQTSLKHPFSPFTHSSVAAVINRVTVSLVPISACCHSTDHFL